MLTWSPFGGGSWRTRSFIRDTLAINAATASWCVAFLMSLPFTYEKAKILITREKKTLFWRNKLRHEKANISSNCEISATLSIEFARKYTTYFRKKKTLWWSRLLTSFERANFKPIAPVFKIRLKKSLLRVSCKFWWKLSRKEDSIFVSFRKSLLTKRSFPDLSDSMKRLDLFHRAKQKVKKVIKFADQGLIDIYLREIRLDMQRELNRMYHHLQKAIKVKWYDTVLRIKPLDPLLH